MTKNPKNLNEFNDLVKKAFASNVQEKDNLSLYFESKAKFYYLYQKLLHKTIDEDTPSTELIWFRWCLENNVDPELKVKD